MTLSQALQRRRQPQEPGEGALVFYSLIAATGFAAGWAVQVLGF